MAKMLQGLPQMARDFDGLLGVMSANVDIFQKVPPGLDHYKPLVTTMQRNVGTYHSVDALPRMSLFPWFFIVPDPDHPRLGASLRRRLAVEGAGGDSEAGEAELTPTAPCTCSPNARALRSTARTARRTSPTPCTSSLPATPTRPPAGRASWPPGARRSAPTAATGAAHARRSPRSRPGFAWDLPPARPDCPGCAERALGDPGM